MSPTDDLILRIKAAEWKRIYDAALWRITYAKDEALAAALESVEILPAKSVSK